MAKKDYRAKLDGDRWACMGDGNKRATSKHDTQREAWDATIDMARKAGSTAFKHGKDGSVKEQRSYAE